LTALLGFGRENKALYTKAGVKAIWQGGEVHELAGCSFKPLTILRKHWDEDFVRVVSCNTTGLCWVILSA
jgi:glyceraldehyde-3-phosphate dehydrogenase (NAD(P))